jgi:hypothetical protein
MYSNRIPPEAPPCNTCKELPSEENEDAVNIFELVKYQLIMSVNGPIEINHQAIHEAMRLYRIEKRRECFEKVIILSRWWIGEMTRKGK